MTAMPRLRSARTAPVLPGAETGMGMLRLPAFWIVLLLLALGGGRISVVMWQYASTFPIALITAVGLFALLAIPFAYVLSELDFLEREPTSLLVIAFAWGGLVATSVSIPGSGALDDIIAKLGSPTLAADWGVALAGPSVEELAKITGVVAIMLIARNQINSVLDGVVYGAVVGLGFQIIEDIVYAMGAVALAGQGDDVRPVLTTFLLRGIMSGLWSHTLFGALAGAGIGYLVVRNERPFRVRVTAAILAVFGAWASHVLWNSPLLRDGLGNGAVALLAVLLFKGLPPLILIWLLVRSAHDREADYYVQQLSALKDPELITPAELDGLRNGARRAAARSHARALAGWKARTAVRRLQRAQARLAVDLSRGAPDLEARVHDLRRRRRALVALGHPEAYVPDGKGPWRRTASAAFSTALAIAVLWAAVSLLGGA
jgi:protease PrsW